VRGLDASLRELASYAPDFLDRPTDEVRWLLAVAALLFLGVGWSAWRWFAR